MRIEFLQSGGVAGVRRAPLIIDTTSLPTEEARRWHNLVAAAEFFNLPSASLPGPRKKNL